MSAPENIYIVQWPSHQSPGGKWHTEIPVIPHPEWIYQYIRHDLHAAAVAERDELRRQRELLVASLAECHQYMKDEETPAQCIKRNRDDMTGLLSLLADERRTVEQLRARLDAEQWKPIETAPFDGRLALVFRPLAHMSNDENIAVKKLIGGNQTCWNVTVPAGETPCNPTDGACHVTHWMPLPIKPPAARGE